MKVEITRVTTWERVVNAARRTKHLEPLWHEPSDTFKKEMIVAEHSPLRLLEFDIIIHDVPYFSVMHLVRHKHGVEPFVATSREDETGIVRSERKQTDLVDVQFSLNAQALINISRKRTCGRADRSTRDIWVSVVRELRKIEPELANACMPECCHRGGFCPEKQCCGYNRTNACKDAINTYQNMIVRAK